MIGQLIVGISLCFLGVWHSNMRLAIRAIEWLWDRMLKVLMEYWWTCIYLSDSCQPFKEGFLVMKSCLRFVLEKPDQFKSSCTFEGLREDLVGRCLIICSQLFHGGMHPLKTVRTYRGYAIWCISLLPSKLVGKRVIYLLCGGHSHLCCR